MTRFITFALSAYSIILFSACSPSTVEQDVEEYCNCIGGMQSESDMNYCFELLGEMEKKFADDSTSVDYMEKYIDHCEELDW